MASIEYTLYLNSLATRALGDLGNGIWTGPDGKGGTVIRAAGPDESGAVASREASGRTIVMIPGRSIRGSLASATAVFPDGKTFRLEHAGEGGASADRPSARLRSTGWGFGAAPAAAVGSPPSEVRDRILATLSRRMSLDELASACGISREGILRVHMERLTRLSQREWEHGERRARVDRWFDLRTGDVSYRRSDVTAPPRHAKRDEIVLLHPRLALQKAMATAKEAHVLDLAAKCPSLAAMFASSPLASRQVRSAVRALRSRGFLGQGDPPAALASGERLVEASISDQTRTERESGGEAEPGQSAA
jgi:hypothetical protein